MGIIERIKEIIFKIKDYDRLESDYCTCLCYFTNNKLSKPYYQIDAVKTVILDSIGEYMDEGYNEATRKAIEWLKKSITNNPETNRIISLNGTVTMGMLIEDFKNYMKGE